MFKMSTFCHSILPTTTSSSFSAWTSLGRKGFHFWSCKIRWTLDFSIPISREHVSMTSLGIVQKPASLYQLSPYQRDFSFFNTDLSTQFTPFHWFQTCLEFLLLLPLLVVVYQIQTLQVVELQQQSPISNNTSVTTYVHRKIISPLWFRGNIVTSHAAGPGSIPGRVNFLVECFSGVFPQP